MIRIIRGNIAKKRRKKIIKYTKGYSGSQSRLFIICNQQYMKSKSNAYSDRRKKKRYYRTLWITRINSNFRNNDLKYNDVIKKLKKDKINLNRKILNIISLIDKNLLEKIITVKL